MNRACRRSASTATPTKTIAGSQGTPAVRSPLGAGRVLPLLVALLWLAAAMAWPVAAAGAFSGAGGLLLRVRGDIPEGSRVDVLAANGTIASIDLHRAAPSSGDNAREFRVRGVPSGVVRLELRGADQIIPRTWDVTIAPGLTTSAELDVDALSIEVLPGHPEPFGNTEDWKRTELRLASEAADDFARDVSSAVNPAATPLEAPALDSGVLPRGARLRPFTPELSERFTAMTLPLGVAGPEQDASRSRIATGRPARDEGVISVSSGNGDRLSIQLRGSLEGRAGLLGPAQAFATFQALDYDQSGALGIAEDDLPANDRQAQELSLRFFARPSEANELRLDFYAFGEQRHHYLHEFRFNSAHTPRVDTARLLATLGYRFSRGPAGLTLGLARSRAFNETGDADRFDALDRYGRLGEDNLMVSADSLYWSGVEPRSHLYNYYQRDVINSWRLDGRTDYEFAPGARFEAGAGAEWFVLRLYERLDPVRAAASPDLLDFTVNYLGYSKDGEDKEDGGPNGARRPILTNLFGRQTVRLGPANLAAGVRYERLEVDQRPVRIPRDPLEGHPELDTLSDEVLAGSAVHDRIHPRIGLYAELHRRTHLWADAGTWWELAPWEALYYSGNLLHHQASLAREGEFGSLPRGASADLIFGNPALRPQRHHQAQLGLAQRLGEAAWLRISGYADNVRDAWTVRTYHATADLESPANVLHYYENDGRVRLRGLNTSLTLGQGGRRLRLLYGLSDRQTNVLEPYQLYRAILRPEAPPEAIVSRETAPLVADLTDYQGSGYFPSILDHRHNLMAGYVAELGPNAGGPLFSSLLGGADLLVSLRARSGAPYTPAAPTKKGRIIEREGNAPPEVFEPAGAFDENGNGIIDPEEVNSGRLPWSWQIDLGLEREFRLWGGHLALMLAVANLTDSRNALEVYPATGEPDDDGWLEGRREDMEPQVVRRYEGRIDNPLHYDDGRTYKVRLAYGF